MSHLVVLVGPPGAGKTTIGRLLAQQQGTEFRDTDEDVEHTAGRSIADIFVSEGEAAFRALEIDAVRAAVTQHRGVLALGGGAVLNPEARELLANQVVVFLDVGLAAATQRVGLNQSRPLLAVNPRATLARMLDERRPVYEQVATITIRTDDREPDEIVTEIEQLLVNA